MGFRVFAAVLVVVVALMAASVASAAGWTAQERQMALASCVQSPPWGWPSTPQNRYRDPVRFCNCFVPYLAAHTTPQRAWFVDAPADYAVTMPLVYLPQRASAALVARCGGHVGH